MVKKRDEFGDPVKRQLANRVACFCSNPSCRVSTHGPHTDPGKARTIGKAGHITAAAAGGPRYDASLTREQRRSAQNGIWVCSSCHDLVDGDELRYPVEMLREWKKLAEEYAAQFIGKRLVPDAESVLTLAPALARIELGVQSLASGSNDIDDALDDAKQELERHDILMARRLVRKLAERHDARLTARQRWRCQTLLACTHLAHGEADEAARLLLEAYPLQPDDEKAKVNRAVAFELTGRVAEAHEYAIALRAELPGSAAAFAVWVRTAPDSLTAAEALAGAGDFAESNVDVASALASRLLKMPSPGLATATRYAAVCTRLDPANAEVWLLSAFTRYQTALRAAGIPDRMAGLRDAVADLGRAAELAEAQGNKRALSHALMNRAVMRGLLGEHGAAGDDFRLAARAAPDDDDIAIQFAVHLSTQNQPDGVVEQTRRACDISPSPRNRFMVAAALHDRNGAGDRERSVELLLELIAAGAGGMAQEAVQSAVCGLCELGRATEASTLLAGLGEGELVRSRLLALQGSVKLSGGDSEAAADLARSALAELADDAHDGLSWLVVQLLTQLGLYAEALPLLTRLARPGVFDRRSRLLLDCAGRVGDDGTVLRVCRELREAGVEDRTLGCQEVDTLRHYDAAAAIELGQRHLRRWPDDHLAKLTVSMAAIACGRPELFTTDYDSLPSPRTAPPGGFGRAVVALLLQANKPREALRYSYALLRAHPGNPDAHSGYLTLCLVADLDDSVVDAPGTVGDGTAVRVRELGGGDEWLVIESDEPDARQGEYAPDSPRGRQVVGKQRGEQFLITGGVQERRGEVVEIRTKYFHRFQEVQNGYQKEFPDRRDFQVVQLAKPTAEGLAEFDLSPLEADTARRSDHVERCLAIYRDNPTPLHVLSQAIGRDLFETMDIVSNRDDTFVVSSSGDDAERLVAEWGWGDGTTVVLDFSAMHTLTRLGLIDWLETVSGVEFVVSQDVAGYLIDLADDNPRLRASARFYSRGPGQSAVVEVPPEESEREAALRCRLLNWVRTKCRVAGARTLADLPPERRRRLWSAFGRDGAGSMALAAETGGVLWTDDITLARIAQAEFGVTRRTWTQASLYSALLTDRLGLAAFNDASARLVGWGHIAIRLDYEVLVRAAELAGWSPAAWPFAQALRTYRTRNAERDESTFYVARFIRGVFAGTQSRPERERACRAMLDTLPVKWLHAHVIQLLESSFHGDSLDYIQACGIVRAWARLSRQVARA